MRISDRKRLHLIRKTMEGVSQKEIAELLQLSERQNTSDLHRKLPIGIDLRQILCIKENRTLKNDFTIQYAGKFYQIKNKVRTKKISVEKWIDSSMHFRCEGKELSYQEIQPPVRKQIIDGPGKNHHVNRVNPPPASSPWRAFMINPPKP